MKNRIKVTGAELVKPARPLRTIQKNKFNPSPEMDREYYAVMRSTDWQKNSCFRAWVMPLVGSGPEQHRDRRHPDLKPKKRRKNIGGFPGNAVSKHGHEISTLHIEAK
jgi:hypothetical protein